MHGSHSRSSVTRRRARLWCPPAVRGCSKPRTPRQARPGRTSLPHATHRAITGSPPAEVVAARRVHRYTTRRLAPALQPRAANRRRLPRAAAAGSSALARAEAHQVGGARRRAHQEEPAARRTPPWPRRPAGQGRCYSPKQDRSSGTHLIRECRFAVLRKPPFQFSNGHKYAPPYPHHPDVRLHLGLEGVRSERQSRCGLGRRQRNTRDRRRELFQPEPPNRSRIEVTSWSGSKSPPLPLPSKPRSSAVEGTPATPASMPESESEKTPSCSEVLVPFLFFGNPLPDWEATRCRIGAADCRSADWRASRFWESSSGNPLPDRQPIAGSTSRSGALGSRS